jgi:hypothetical protein
MVGGVGFWGAPPNWVVMCLCFLGPIKPPMAATKQLYFDTVKGIMLEINGAGPWEGEQGNMKRWLFECSVR